MVNGILLPIFHVLSMVKWLAFYRELKGDKVWVVCFQYFLPILHVARLWSYENLTWKKKTAAFESPANLCKLVEIVGRRSCWVSNWKMTNPPPTLNAFHVNLSYFLPPFSLSQIHHQKLNSIQFPSFSFLFLETSLSPSLLLLSSSSSSISSCSVFYFLWYCSIGLNFFSNFLPSIFKYCKQAPSSICFSHFPPPTHNFIQSQNSFHFPIKTTQFLFVSFHIFPFFIYFLF